MRRIIFSFLSSIVRVLPKMWKQDMLNLNKMQMAIVGFKVWVTYNYLDEKKKHNSKQSP